MINRFIKDSEPIVERYVPDIRVGKKGVSAWL